MYGQELNLVVGGEVGVWVGYGYKVGTVEKVSAKGQATVRLSATCVYRFTKEGKIITSKKYLNDYRLHSVEVARSGMYLVLSPNE